jgi:DNA-binding NarL/FixJ family response regulator
MTIRILIADDHGLIRTGLHALISSVANMEVVGEATDGQTALSLTEELKPDIVVMDISMSGLNGIEATRHLRETSPETRVIALTVHEDEGMLREMINAGAKGYVIKRAAETDLIHAIEAVMQGYIYVHPAMISPLLKNLSPDSKPGPVNEEPLTPREIQVLRLLARGYTNRQIALEMNLSQRTIEGHRSSLVNKLGISSRVELMEYVEQHGLSESK